MSVDASQYEITEDQLQAAIAAILDLITSGNAKEHPLQMATLIGVIATFYVGKFDGVEPDNSPSIVMSEGTGQGMCELAAKLDIPNLSGRPHVDGAMVKLILRKLLEKYGPQLIALALAYLMK